MKSPCQNCTKRTVWCHSNCESYINFRNGVDNIKERMRADKEIERLWDELEDVPTDENECIDIDWHGWSKGTHREEIWYWFDEHHSKGVGWLMNERETEY